MRLIDADDLAYWMEKRKKENTNDVVKKVFDIIIYAIQSWPEVKPPKEQKKPHGYWIHDEDWECSVCHSHFPESKFMANDYGTPVYNYCPICGADLTGR